MDVPAIRVPFRTDRQFRQAFPPFEWTERVRQRWGTAIPPRVIQLRRRSRIDRGKCGCAGSLRLVSDRQAFPPFGWKERMRQTCGDRYTTARYPGRAGGPIFQTARHSERIDGGWPRGAAGGDGCRGFGTGVVQAGERGWTFLAGARADGWQNNPSVRTAAAATTGVGGRRQPSCCLCKLSIVLSGSPVFIYLSRLSHSPSPVVSYGLHARVCSAEDTEGHENPLFPPPPAAPSPPSSKNLAPSEYQFVFRKRHSSRIVVLKFRKFLDEISLPTEEDGGIVNPRDASISITRYDERRWKARVNSPPVCQSQSSGRQRRSPYNSNFTIHTGSSMSSPCAQLESTPFSEDNFIKSGSFGFVAGFFFSPATKSRSLMVWHGHAQLLLSAEITVWRLARSFLSLFFSSPTTKSRPSMVSHGCGITVSSKRRKRCGRRFDGTTLKS